MGSAETIVAVLALLAGVVGLAGGILELCRAALELRRSRRDASPAACPARAGEQGDEQPVEAGVPARDQGEGSRRGSARPAPRRW